MVAGEVLDSPYAPPPPPSPPAASSSASPPSPRRNRRSIHRALGGGAVADVLLWRRRNAAILVATSATAVWFIFEWAGYSFLSLMANAFLLVVVILFFWAKSASLLNRPLPPLPNLEVSEEFVGKAADEAWVWINRVLAVGHDIAIRRDRKVFLQVTLLLWLLSYIGSLFNFLTLVYIGVLLSIILPALYERYQDHVDEKLAIARKLLLKHYDNIVRRGTSKLAKEKKTQ